VFVPSSLSSIEDALCLAEVALGPDDLVAIVDGAAKLVMPISGDVLPDSVLAVDEIVLGVAGDIDDCRLVLATRRHHGPSIVLESELALWRQLQAAHHGCALRLVDWLVLLDDGIALSLAELAGPPPVWG
jgi:hypothetical protein